MVSIIFAFLHAVLHFLLVVEGVGGADLDFIVSAPASLSQILILWGQH